MPKTASLLLLSCFAVLTFSACTTQRTNSLQNRQNWMNNQADAAAERRAIRSQNMDDRVQATFDAM